MKLKDDLLTLKVWSGRGNFFRNVKIWSCRGVPQAVGRRMSPLWGDYFLFLKEGKVPSSASADRGLTKIVKRIDAETGHLLKTNSCYVQCNQLKFPTPCLLDHTGVLEVRMHKMPRVAGFSEPTTRPLMG
jgi:hypothetical protein